MIYTSTKESVWPKQGDFMRTSATTSTTNMEFKNLWTKDDNHEDDNANESFDAFSSVLISFFAYYILIDSNSMFINWTEIRT